MSAASDAVAQANAAVAAADQAEQDFAAGRISEADLHSARDSATDAQNAATDARNAEFLASQEKSQPDPMPQPVQSFNAPAEQQPSAPSSPAVVAPSSLAQQAQGSPAPQSYRSPAFDINGNLVTIDLPGGDYANLPAGYYVSPGDAAVARHDQHNTGSETPLTAQEVGKIFSDTNPATQAALGQIFAAPPPPPSTYVAPTPPVEIGWTPPPVTPPPTSADLIAQMYVANGYTPPPDHVIQQIISGEISAPLTTPLPVDSTSNASNSPLAVNSPAAVAVDNSGAGSQTPQNPAAVMTAAQYAAQRPDLLVNWARAQNPAWVVSHPSALSVVQFINQFPSLTAFLSNDAGTSLSAPEPGISPDIAAQVASEIPVNAEPPASLSGNSGPTAIQYAAERSDLMINWARAHSPAWVSSHPTAAAVVNFITNFPTLSAYLSHDFGSQLSGPEPTVSADVMAYVQNEIPAGTTAASGGGTHPTSSGGGTTQSLARPQIQVGTTSAGWPIFQVGDDAGQTKQWIASPSGTVDLINAQIYGTMVHDAQTDQAVATAGGGTVGTSGLAKPQIQVGTTSAGWPIFQVGDDAGATKQWIIDPGPPSRIVDLLNAPTYGQLFHDAVTDAAVKNSGGGVVTTAGGTSAGKSNLLLLAAAAAVAYFAFAR